MNDTIAQRNIATAKLLLEDAMPNGDFDLVRSLVTPDAPIRRAGFADLYALTGDAIPQSGNFVEWLEAGWKVLSARPQPPNSSPGLPRWPRGTATPRPAPST
ncbi:hypothetical protein ABZ016_27345 [Streptomyces sp. NPDC006372]|uniref:hypothetical protein n=1 Tax=Streptomyces sp. NPDC006372 TaxID=3155599 RepID=UPI0033AD081C